MASRRPSWLRYRVLRSAWKDARLVWRLFQDTRVPLWMKVVFPLAGTIYLLSPLDFLPDVIPFLGEVDDVMVLLLLMRLFISLSPEDVVEDVLGRMSGKQASKQVVEGSYRIVD